MNEGKGKRSTYHKIAYDALQSRRPQSAVDSLLEAAEIGDDKKLMELVSKYRTIINLKCISSGDTALITAARNGHSTIVEYLMKSGADPALQNDIGENALNVAPPQIKDLLLAHLSKERPSTANRLLQAAWLGDLVTVKKNLSGGIINVNCKNSEGLTPLLLVTRDIKTFNKVHKVMKTDYDPLGVMQELLKHKADLTACDSNGRTALHLISNEGPSSVGAVQAKRVVSLLLQNGSSTNIADKNGYTPLHIAAKNGHTAIIVALLEEGDTDIDCRGGENRDTPLIISVREGHKETAEYLLSKGADVTLAAESGDTALSLAKTSSMTALIKDAWDKSTASETIGAPCEGSDTESDLNTDTDADLNADTDTDHTGTVPAPFFITQNNGRLRSSHSLTRLESVDTNDEEMRRQSGTPDNSQYSEVEADDEQEANKISKRHTPAKRRSLLRQSMITSKRNATNAESALRRSQLTLSKSMECLNYSGRHSSLTTPTGDTPTHTVSYSTHKDTPTRSKATPLKRLSLPAVHGASLRSVGSLIPVSELMQIESEREKYHSLNQRSNSMTSINKSSIPHLQPVSSSTSKIPFLPSVVTPQLVTATNTSSSRSKQSRAPATGQSRTTGTGPRTTGTVSRTPLATGGSSSTLSVVREEYSSTDKTLTPTDHGPDYDDTIKLSRDTMTPSYELQSEATASNNDEYITSNIGSRTPFPYHLLTDTNTSTSASRKTSGIDSGHEGEGEHSSSSSDSEDPVEQEEREELRWKKGKLLGRGAYGKVFEGLLDTAKLIAVKEVDLEIEENDKSLAQFKKIQLEVDILRSLSHKNIVQYLGTSINESIVYIFMEYISGGSLQSILKRFGSLNEKTIVHYVRQMGRGLNYLHKNGVIHRDIKGANVMVTAHGTVKLIDFGCAKRHCLDQSLGFHSVRGTPYWMAPEVICGRGYGRKSDIWSLGCTIYEMIFTRPPWGELPPEAAMFKIGLGQSLPTLPKHSSKELISLYTSCIKSDPGQRPTAQEVLNHTFLTKK